MRMRFVMTTVFEIASTTERNHCQWITRVMTRTPSERATVGRAAGNWAADHIVSVARRRFFSSVLQIAPAPLLAASAMLLAWGAYVHSPTLNEPGHLASGLSHWKLGQFEAYCVNPPLVRMIAAIPVLLAGPETNWRSLEYGSRRRPEFALGEDFVACNGERCQWYFVLARWACIPMVLLGGYLCYRWATALYGPTGGLLALALWCFCPNILGHGQLITADVGATVLSLAACYSFWLWLKRPTWPAALTSGAVLGLAELTKMTLVVLLPLWLVMWLTYRWQDRHEIAARGWLRELGMLAARMAIALYVVNLGYGFDGSCTRLGEFKFFSAALGAAAGAEKAPAVGGNRFAKSWLASVPVPLPRNYLSGIDLQRKDFENYPRPSYLAGSFSRKGWWYYYLYALAIKVPLGTWLLVLLAASCRLWPKMPAPPVDSDQGWAAPTPTNTDARPSATWRDEFVLLCPAVAVLALVSSQTGFSEHMRYVLPAFPFCYVWIGRLAPLLGAQRRLLTGVAAAALLWSVASSLVVYPHSLSYFNELAGGPMGGPRHLIHSNVDWGQDLHFLKRWLDEHPEAKPLNLAYFGYVDPKTFGIEYRAPVLPAATEKGESPRHVPPGWYAISVNFVRGLPHFSYQGEGRGMVYAQDALERFQRLRPIATAGYSIYIYHVE